MSGDRCDLSYRHLAETDTRRLKKMQRNETHIARWKSHLRHFRNKVESTASHEGTLRPFVLEAIRCYKNAVNCMTFSNTLRSKQIPRLSIFYVLFSFSSHRLSFHRPLQSNRINPIKNDGMNRNREISQISFLLALVDWTNRIIRIPTSKDNRVGHRKKPSRSSCKPARHARPKIPSR